MSDEREYVTRIVVHGLVHSSAGTWEEAEQLALDHAEQVLAEKNPFAAYFVRVVPDSQNERPQSV